MEPLIGALRPYLGDGLLLVVVVAMFVVVNSGIIPRWFSEHRRARSTERDRLSADQWALIKSHEQEADNQRRWRAEDAERDSKRIAFLEERLTRQEEVIAKLAAAVESSERGNARLRHALNNVFQYIAGVRDLAISRGESPPQYNGWRTMLGLSEDLDAQLRRLFQDVDNKSNC